jgi:signal transduction histidine kinase
MPQKYKDFIRNLILAAIYFAAAKIGLSLDPVSGFASLVWPPTGIALAATFIYGYKVLPGIFIGAFLANFTTGASMPVSAGIGFGNTLESVVGVYLLRTFANFNYSLETIKDVLGLLVFAALASTVFSSTIGTTCLLLGGVIPNEKFIETWSAWWFGDMLGDLVIAPLIFVWYSKAKTFFIRLDILKTIETLFLFSLLILVFIFVFFGQFGISNITLPYTYLVFSPLILIALRLGQLGTVSSIFLLSIFSICGTYFSGWPYVESRLNFKLIYLQGFIGISALTFLTLSAVLAERKKLELLKDEFISSASHELKTPITTIKAYTQLLNNTYKEKNKNSLKMYLQRMDEQVNRLVKLVSELLDVSRIQSGKMELTYERIDFNNIVKEVVNDMNQTTSHNIVFKSRGQSIIKADGFRLNQVLINLIANAIKYSPKSKKIIVKLNTVKGQLTVSVKDFGIGIDPFYHQEIFKRFYQTRKKSVEDNLGLGLGLYISSEIIKNHGGKIWVKSSVGKGSTFYFSIPAREK